MKTPWSNLLKEHGAAFATFIVASICGLILFAVISIAVLVAKIMVLIK